MTVTLERPDERIAVVRMDRPEARNALDIATRELLAETRTVAHGLERR